jgi:hypothetical protein
MKVAVCFSGTARTPDNGLESLKLIFPNDDVKVFGHTWINLIGEKDHVNSDLDLDRGSNFSLLKEFNFETLLVESYKSKKTHFQKMYDFFNFKIHQSPPRTDLGIISMFYSIYQSNSLKRKYEISNNMKFDKVVRVRFDSNFEGKLLNLNNFNFSLLIPDGNDWNGGINDQFAIGSSESMDIYCDLYNCFSMVKHMPYHPESMLREYLKIRNIEISRFDFNISISSSRLSWDQR